MNFEIQKMELSEVIRKHEELLSSLENRFLKGDISDETYNRLRDKYQSKLTENKIKLGEVEKRMG